MGQDPVRLSAALFLDPSPSLIYRNEAVYVSRQKFDETSDRLNAPSKNIRGGLLRDAGVGSKSFEIFDGSFIESDRDLLLRQCRNFFSRCTWSGDDFSGDNALGLESPK
jgi:hypothetical protein